MKPIAPFRWLYWPLSRLQGIVAQLKLRTLVEVCPARFTCSLCGRRATEVVFRGLNIPGEANPTRVCKACDRDCPF